MIETLVSLLAFFSKQYCLLEFCIIVLNEDVQLFQILHLARTDQQEYDSVHCFGILEVF